VVTRERVDIPQRIAGCAGVAGRLARRTESELLRRAASGDQLAREQLVTRFMPLARSLALRYRRSAEPFDDLLQVASLGLVKAIDGFDPQREIAFTSYAVPTILGEIKRYFRDRTWAVRVPRGLQELSLRVDHAVGRLAEELGRQPSVAEIAAVVGSDEESVLEALQAGGAYRTLSFQAPRGTDDDGSTLGDSIGVEEYGFERAEERAMLATLQRQITPREREVLRLRFEQDMTQAEIGLLLGVSQMQVSRIVRQALERLRAATNRPLERRLEIEHVEAP
jgi:RNA polymerase sigma-B factor